MNAGEDGLDRRNPVMSCGLQATDRRAHSPVVHLVRCREAFGGPVDEAVQKDNAGQTRPHPHDHPEGHARFVDQLGRRDQKGWYTFKKTSACACT